MINLEVWASGNGSNAENLVQYFRQHPAIRIRSICTTNPRAGVLERAKTLGVPAYITSLDALSNGTYLEQLNQRNVNGLVLAGFLKLVPQIIVHAFSQKIVNVHPALLPKYGGKGMYGINVHRAVVENEEKLSGITIHKVNEKFDEGEILAQFTTVIHPSDNPESVALKIHTLEQHYFPKVVEAFFTGVHAT